MLPTFANAEVVASIDIHSPGLWTKEEILQQWICARNEAGASHLYSDVIPCLDWEFCANKGVLFFRGL